MGLPGFGQPTHASDGRSGFEPGSVRCP